MNVLYISLEFPPINSAGTFRTLKFIKKLSKEKFVKNITLLTFSEEAVKEKFNTSKINYKLLKDIPEKVRVIKSIDNRTLKLFSNYFFNQIMRRKALKRELDNVLRSLGKKKEYNLVVVTVPFFGSAFIANQIREHLGIKNLILDVRDDMVAPPFFVYRNYLFYLKKLYEENYLFKSATKIITVTDPLANRIIRRNSKGIKAKLEVIPNSYEGELSVIQKNRSISNESKVIIGYTGSFYYEPGNHQIMAKPFYKRGFKNILSYFPYRENWLYRSPYFFLKTLKILIDNYKLSKEIEFHHIGDKPQWLVDMVKDMGLKEYVIFHGFLPMNDVQELQKKWDAFLITSEKVMGQDHYCIPSKIFDYLKYNTPIIGFVTRGPLWDILSKTNRAILVDPDNINYEKIIPKLKEIENIDPEIDKQIHVQYSIENTSRHFINTIKLIK
ncbi:MAG: glycosyltransferase [Bacteroidia bacterium]